MRSFQEASKKGAKPEKEFVVLLSVLRVTKGGLHNMCLWYSEVKKKKF